MLRLSQDIDHIKGLLAHGFKRGLPVVVGIVRGAAEAAAFGALAYVSTQVELLEVDAEFAWVVSAVLVAVRSLEGLADEIDGRRNR